MGEPDCCLSCKTAASATIGNRPLRTRTVGGVGGRREYPHAPTRCVLGMSTSLTGEVPSAGSSTKRIADDKGVYREMESERSPRQNVGPTNRNRMRHTKVDKPADQGEVLSYSEPEVYMRRANDVKERALTRGGLTDDNPVDWRSKACCEKSAEVIVPSVVDGKDRNLWR